MWHAFKFTPAIILETSKVLFEVFIGWPLLSSIWGILFVLYVVPFIFPEMGLSSVFVELHREFIGGQLPGILRLVTTFV